ncbi:MAG: tetratricopeptide repeat protein [Acidobacteriota bacterium]
MRKTLALVAIVALAATGALFIQRLNQEEHYKRLLGEGEAALASGQTYVAIEAFSGALALRPSSMVASYRRGEAYAAEGQDERAILDFQEARHLAPDAPEPLQALGRLYDRQGDPAEAADWFAKAADHLKDADPSLLYTLALARYRAGSPTSARDPLRQALARNDSMAEAHYLLGLVYRDAQQPDEAVASLERAVRLAPSLLAAREELADLYRERGRFDDEARELGALASLDQQLDREIALALAHMRAGRYTEALEVLKRPDAAAAMDSRVALTTGRIYLARAERTGDRASISLAQSSLERALGGTARRSEGLALFGRALYLSGNYVSAERLLRDAIATTPIDTEAFAFLADAAEQVSHPDIARDALIALDALEGDTVSAEVRAARVRRIGGLAVAAGDGQTGVEYLTLAIKAGQSDAATLGLLARAQWQIGDRDDARRTLGQALALDARDADLRRLSRVIK